jgi:hypothetical protein
MNETHGRHRYDHRPLRRLLQNTAIVLIATLLPPAIGEVALRVYHHDLFSVENLRVPPVESPPDPRAVYDADLGYVPKTGIWKGRFTATIGESGLRLNGPNSPDTRARILAVGDSFTFGDDVADTETWPAHLERMLGRSVLNGGVFGYGVDQTVLRAERLVQLRDPQVLLVSMIADDLRRAEMSYRYAWKPYFAVVDGALELRNVPVPMLPPPVRFERLRDILSYSRLANAIFRRLSASWWIMEGDELRVHDQGQAVAQLLMHRLHDALEGNNVRVVIVAQADRSMDTLSLLPVLESARAVGFETIDLAGELAILIDENPNLFEDYFLGTFSGHMSSRGNEWVARRLADVLFGSDQLIRAGDP